MSDTTISEESENQNSTPEDGKSEKISSAVEKIDAVLSGSKIKKKQDALKKKRGKWAIAFLSIILLSYGVHWLLLPFKGTMAFGICKVFLELNVRFPDKLRLSSIEEFPTSVRIWYTEVNSFGEYKMDPIQCYYKPDEQLGFILERITVNRRELDTKVVDDFNRVLPIIFANPPDLTYPSKIPDSLENMEINIDLFRRPIL